MKIKLKYIFIAGVQLASILTSGILRRICFNEIDFMEEQPMSPMLRASFYALLLWLATIILSAGLAILDKENRAMIFLFLVLLLPFFESLAWLATSF